MTNCSPIQFGRKPQLLPQRQPDGVHLRRVTTRSVLPTAVALQGREGVAEAPRAGAQDDHPHRAQTWASHPHRRAAARFAPEVDEAAPARDLDEVLQDAAGGDTSDRERPAQQQQTLAAEEEDTYTSRLLKAKQQARKNQ